MRADGNAIDGTRYGFLAARAEGALVRRSVSIA
jgi:hypothetical protein